MNGPIRTIAMVCGVLLVVASALTIAAGLRGGPASPPRTIAALPTRTPAAVPTASPGPTSSPAPRPSAAPTPSPSYAPLERVPVRPSTSAPAATATPSPAPSPKPTNSPSPRPAAATSAPRPRPAASATESLIGGPDDEACVRPLTYLKTAADDRVGRREAYNAALAGLAMNAHCPEPRRGVNEGYLLAMKAPAEFALHTGDWNADLNRSDMLLEACASAPVFRGTTVSGDCAIQRKFNDVVRKRILQLGGRRSPSGR